MQELYQYIEYLKNEKHKPKNTLAAYRADLEIFLNYLESVNKSIKKSTRADVLKFADSQLESGKSSATVARYLSSVKGFYNYLYTEKKLPVNISRSVKNKPFVQKSVEYLTVDEMERLLMQPDITDPKGMRDKTIIELLYATGLKITEFIEINVSDVNVDLKHIILKKGENMRYVPIHDAAAELLELYIKNIRPLFTYCSDEAALFVNVDGARITRQGLWKLIRKYGTDAGIKKDVTVQTIRNSYAVHLLENGADMRTVQRLLGHTKLSTTQNYSYSLKLSGQADVYRKYHPRSSLVKRK